MSRCRGPGRVAGAGVVDGSRCAVRAASRPRTASARVGGGAGDGARMRAVSQLVSQRHASATG